MPPQVNARLTKVTGATAATGGRDDFDDPVDAGGDEPAGAGATKWEGRVAAYFQEKVERRGNGGAVDVSERRTVYVDTADIDTMSLDTDDVITLELEGTGTLTARATAIAASRLAGVPRNLQTTRIDLEVR